ncbi:MAG: hypothetical protein ACYSWW_28485, partial [Planctomycetota bacterium]
DDAAGEAIWQTWIDGFGVDENGSQVGNLVPPYAEQTIVHGGRQSMPFLYDNGQGAARYSETERTFAQPDDWTRGGVTQLSVWFRGYAGSVGSFVESPVGTFTMTGSGTDIWDNADEFHFAYKTLTGPGTIVARVESVQNTDPWAKAGVMIRETLDPGSTHALACVTPENGAASQGRIDTGGSSFNTAEGGITAPHWVKLERSIAGAFTVSHSADGSSWVPVAGANPTNIQMSSTVYVGLAVTSHNAGATCEAVFSNVTTTGTVSDQWTNQDIGIAVNDAEPMYVGIADSAGTLGFVEHEDPSVTQIDTWTRWSVDLAEFADQGVNLAGIQKIILGVGNRANSVPGGSGKMYFDDIAVGNPVQAPAVLTNVVFEAEDASVLGSSWRIYDDSSSSSGTHIGSDNGDGDDNDAAPGAEWVAGYNFTADAGVYKIVAQVIAPTGSDDSFWIRIVGATSQTHEDPDQPGTGWVRFNSIEAGDAWHWDEVHSNDHDNELVTWTLAAGEHTLEIAKREDGTLLDALIITDDLALDQATLP